MEGVAVSAGHFLRYWHPTSGQEIARTISDVAEVVHAADVATDTYRQAKVSYLPGISIWRGVDVPENALGLGIASDGWAIIHTDEEYWQTITRSSRELDGVLRMVRFDDSVEVPGVSFIDRDLAVEVVAYWLATGDILESVRFSDDLISH